MMHDSDVEIGPAPVPVEIVGTQTTKEPGPEFGSWRAIQLIGAATDQAQQILPQAPLRHRAVIAVVPGAAGNTAGTVYVGSRKQVQTGNPAVTGAGQLVNGSTIVVESQDEVWVQSDLAHSLTITVLDERYRK